MPLQHHLSVVIVVSGFGHFLFLMIKKEPKRDKFKCSESQRRESSISFLLAITSLSAQKAGDFMAFKMTEGRFNKHESKA